MLYRRYGRELKRNPGMYFAIFLILAIGLGTVLGGNAGDDSMIAAVEDFLEDAQVSDGYATMAYPISEETINGTEDLKIAEDYYLDLEAENGELRIFKNRDEMNRAYVREGALPEKEGEIFLEEHYSETNQYEIGSTLEIEGNTYTVTGIGCLPDYIYVLKKSSDMSSHTGTFSVALVSEKDWENLEEEYAEELVYQYDFLLQNKSTIEDAEAFFKEISNNIRIDFVNNKLNSRITTYKEDCAMVKRATFVFAVVLMIVIAYVMSVFQKNRVEKERKYIGTLSALGYRKRELILHYLGLPMWISFAGGVGSLICGYLVFSKMLTQDSVDLYSMPEFSVTMPAYIILFGLIVPPVIMGIIGAGMLFKKIADCPEQIMKPTQKIKTSDWKLDRFSYLTAFRIRQGFKELTGNVVIIGGIFVSTILLLLGCSIYGSVAYYKERVLNDVPYQYMYYVSGNEEIPDGAEKLCVQSMKAESDVRGVDLNITLYGIPENSSYFETEQTDFKEEDGAYPVVISDAMAKKCGLEKGDSFEISDSAQIESYTLKVEGIMSYSNGLSIFMDLNELNEMMDFEADHYNAVISGEELDKDTFHSLSVTKASEYEEAADSMLESLMLIILALLGSAVVVFVMVIYLMVKFMMDKAKYNISLLEILGYRMKEVNKIYLGGETWVVILGIAVSLPFGTLVLNGIFPYLTSGYSVYLKPYISMAGYAALTAFMLISYWAVYLYLKHQVKKIQFADILKERE